MDRPYPDDGPWPHPQFTESRAKVQQKVVDEYANLYVAWNWEGTQVVAAANDPATLDAKLADLGIDANRVAVEYLEIERFLKAFRVLLCLGYSSSTAYLNTD